jgi:hypothetical protein
LDEHGFGAVVLGQAIWFVIAATLLWNEMPQTAAVS